MPPDTHEALVPFLDIQENVKFRLALSAFGCYLDCMKLPNTIPAPKPRDDGSCPQCIGGWQCAYHQQQGIALDRSRSEAIKLASESLRRAEISRVCARYELETDEAGTCEDKALRILAKMVVA